MDDDVTKLKEKIDELQLGLDQCLKKISDREKERDEALDNLAIMTARVRKSYGYIRQLCMYICPASYHTHIHQDLAAITVNTF